MLYLVILIRNAGLKKIPDWISVFYVNYRCSFKKQTLDQNSLYQDADWKCLSESVILESFTNDVNFKFCAKKVSKYIVVFT